jgi:hypothetical protein
MTTDERTKPVTELFEQATKNYEQALKTGLKLQEESGKLWTNLFNQVSSPQDWQKKVKTTFDDVIPQTQKTLDETLKLVEQNSRTGVELFKKAVAAGQSTSLQDAQARFLGLWEASLNALRDTTQAVVQNNTRAIESWIEFARKNGEPEAKAAKAA